MEKREKQQEIIPSIGSFFTAVNCLDGRTHLPLIYYLRKRFAVDYVDLITEPGPNRILAEGKPLDQLESIRVRIRLSIAKHASCGIAVAGHFGCVGNPSSCPLQETHTLLALQQIESWFPDIPVVGLWINSQWQVEEVAR